MTAGQTLGAVISPLVAGIVALAVVISRARERITRLEEWIRQHERTEAQNEHHRR